MRFEPALENPLQSVSPLAKLLEDEKAKTCGFQSRLTYAAFHRARFEEIVRVCKCFVPNPSARVLDIGRSELTAHLSSFYGNVSSLGFDPAIDDGGHRESSSLRAVPHITFNLLDSVVVSRWPQCDPFDLIVFSEVIEHLHIAPEYVLACLGSILSPQGVLICTTPNAADITKRIKLVLGLNPYERIRLYENNPGHFREYTRRELASIAANAGLRFEHHSYRNWGTGGGNAMKALALNVFRILPPFRPFQLCVLSRKAASK